MLYCRSMAPPNSSIDFADLAARIKSWGQELGFQQLGIADTDLGRAEARLRDWLAHGFHGEMDYMARHGPKRTRPAQLVTRSRRSGGWSE